MHTHVRTYLKGNLPTNIAYMLTPLWEKWEDASMKYTLWLPHMHAIQHVTQLQKRLFIATKDASYYDVNLMGVS